MFHGISSDLFLSTCQRHIWDTNNVFKNILNQSKSCFTSGDKNQSQLLHLGLSWTAFKYTIKSRLEKIVLHVV